MKSNRSFSHWLWSLVLLMGLAAASPDLRAADAENTPGVAPPEAAAPVDPADAPAPPTQRLNEVVSIFGDARVERNQVADQVVVVRGDAVIDGDVKGDVVVVFGHLTLKGKVRGDVVVVLGNADIDGTVGGELALILTPGNLHRSAVVKRDLVAVGVAPVIDAGARVDRRPKVVSLGPVVHYFDGVKDYLLQGVLLLRPFPPRLGWVWWIAGAFLVFHLALALVFAGALRGCMETLASQPARSFLVGLLVCVLVGPVSVLLSFTVVATPLIWLAYLALCVFGRVAVYGAAGASLGRGTGGSLHPVAAVLVGSVLFYVCYMIPVLGFLAYWIILPLGVGATLIRVFDALRRERRPGWTPPAGRDATGGGSLAAAGALAGGAPGPATHALVTEPAAPSAGPGEPPRVESRPGERSTPPPVVPIPTLDAAALPRVGFWPRCGATLIDLLVIFAAVLLLSLHTPRAFWLLLGAYHLGMWVWKGTTLGGSVLGLRVVRLDGRRLDWSTAAYRLLGSVVSLLPLGLGFFWVAWDAECQSWHDRIAGTTVVRADRRASLT